MGIVAEMSVTWLVPAASREHSVVVKVKPPTSGESLRGGGDGRNHQSIGCGCDGEKWILCHTLNSRCCVYLSITNKDAGVSYWDENLIKERSGREATSYLLSTISR